MQEAGTTSEMLNGKYKLDYGDSDHFGFEHPANIGQCVPIPQRFKPGQRRELPIIPERKLVDLMDAKKSTYY